MIKKTALSLFHGWWKFTAGCLIGICFSFIAPGLIPVVANMKATDWQVSEAHVQATVVGWKLRCKLIKGSEVGFLRMQGEPWHEVAFQFKEDPTPGNSRPFGFQSFGVWWWEKISAEKPHQAMITIDHECNDDVVTTSIGPFQVSP